MDESKIIEERQKDGANAEMNHFSSLVNYLHSGIDIVSYDYRVIFQNKMLRNRFGDIKGKICYNEYVKRKSPCPDCPMRKAIENNRIAQRELTGADGRSYEIVSTPLKNFNGEKAAVEVVTDITDRRQKEEKLKKERCRLKELVKKNNYQLARANQRLKQDIANQKQVEGRLCELEKKWLSLVRNVPEIILNVAPDGTILSINHTVKGIKAKEAIGRSVYEFVAPEFCSIVKKSLEYVFQTGKTTIYTVAGNGDYGPETAWYETRAIPVTYNKKTAAVTLICTDITERKKTEEALEEYRRRYYDIFEGSKDTIYIATYQGKFFSINESCLKLFGYTEKEILNLNVRNLCVNPKSYEIFSQQLKQNGYVENFNIRLRQKNGREIECLISATARQTNRNEDGIYQAMVNDVTIQKRAETKLKQSLEQSRRIIEGTILAMAKAVEMRDPYTAGHQRRVSRLAYIIAKRMKLSKNQLEAVRVAGTLHDIGKIYVPSEILTKSRKLNEAEFNLVKEHPRVGYEILKNEKFPWPIAKIVHQHHERMNGSGYPAGLCGKDIMLEARILAVADIVEAMASHRPYRPALGIDKALEEISRNKGILYDPVAVDICIVVFTKKGNFKFRKWPPAKSTPAKILKQ